MYLLNFIWIRSSIVDNLTFSTKTGFSKKRGKTQSPNNRNNDDTHPCFKNFFYHVIYIYEKMYYFLWVVGMISRKIFFVFLGFVFGYLIIKSFYSKTTIHGPNSNLVKKKIFFDQTVHQCYQYIPQPYVCPLYLLKNDKGIRLN